MDSMMKHAIPPSRVLASMKLCRRRLQTVGSKGQL